MAATVHGNVGRRAAAANDRKVVFKSVLDNPFQVSWPIVPQNVQNVVLAVLLTTLTGVAEYHLARQVASRKRKLARHDKDRKEKAHATKKRKIDKINNVKGANVEIKDNGAEDDNTGVEDSLMELRGDRENSRKKRKIGNQNIRVEDANTECEDTGNMDENPGSKPSQMNHDTEPPLPPPPPIFSHLTFGINEVTKRLEAQSHSLRLRTSILPYSSTTPAAEGLESATDPPPLTHVFVCRADVDPPLLIAHFPELVAACNDPSPTKPLTPVQLISLPKHAEHSLADAVGLRRVSVLALDATTPSLATFVTLLGQVQPPSAPWLTAPTTSHIPTHIKQLRTTAPRDIRAAKRERTEGRREAKEKRKENNKNKDKNKRDGKPVPAAKEKVHKPREKKRIKILASGP